MTKEHSKQPSVIVSYKEVGETPKQVIDLLKERVPELKDTPMTYAGRLDPMAEGILVILLGEEVHKKDEYLKLKKTYDFQVVFGFSTDTHDLLGKVTDTKEEAVTVDDIQGVLPSFRGTYMQQYPAYSSKPVDGKPLFEWARASQLHEISIPSREISVDSLELIGLSSISASELKSEIHARIGKVSGDFRQDEIIELWDAYIDLCTQELFTLASFEVSCSHGTYVRKLVDDMGAAMNMPATTFAIQRTSVGSYTIEDAG